MNLNTCALCGKKYDVDQTKRIFGDAFWISRYCSAQCYTDSVTEVKKDTDDVIFLNLAEKTFKFMSCMVTSAADKKDNHLKKVCETLLRTGEAKDLQKAMQGALKVLEKKGMIKKEEVKNSSILAAGKGGIKSK